MLSDIKSGTQIDYILVYKLSRSGRNAADILSSLQTVQDYGVNLISVEEGIDSSQAIDNLPLDAKYRERKLRDMSARLDGLYDSMAELEENIAVAELRKTAMEENAITLDNIYKYSCRSTRFMI